MRDPRFPIGEFVQPENVSASARKRRIHDIANLPARLRIAVARLDEEQLDTPYREGGWTVRQVVHHLADSHINSYARFRFALAETLPTVMAYDEKAWAELPDAKSGPIDVSVRLLDALHERWAALLTTLGPEDFEREYLHSESGRHNVDYLLALYAWHGNHHLAHITYLREREGW